MLYLFGTSEKFWLIFFGRGVKSGNAAFSRDIAAWTFQESLVLRIDKIEHHRVNATESLEQYTTNDQLVSLVLVFPYFILTCSNLRCTAPTSQNSIRRKAHGSLFLAWKTFNLNLQCLTPTSVLHSRLYPVFQENIPLRSVRLIGTVYSNSWSITNVQGKSNHYVSLTSCSSIMVAGRICIAPPRSQWFLLDTMGTHDSCLQHGHTMRAPSVPVLDSSCSVLSGSRER